MVTLSLPQHPALRTATEVLFCVTVSDTTTSKFTYLPTTYLPIYLSFSNKR